jgi:hypothetical protein
MKKIFASFGWMLLLLPLISVAGARTAFAVNNTATYNSRDVSGFDGIASGGSFKVHVSFGSKESLRIEASDEAIKEIETVVEDGTLKLRFKKRTGGWLSNTGDRNFGRIDIYVTAVKLKRLSVSGSGDMDVAGTVKSDKVSSDVSGSGSLTFAVSAESYSAGISGSGHLEVSGTAKSASVKVSGSGGFRGSDLKTDNASVGVSGSGNVNINVNSSLTASVSGSGSVKYSGNATNIVQNRSGSGRISKM